MNETYDDIDSQADPRLGPYARNASPTLQEGAPALMADRRALGLSSSYGGHIDSNESWAPDRRQPQGDRGEDDVSLMPQSSRSPAEGTHVNGHATHDGTSTQHRFGDSEDDDDDDVIRGQNASANGYHHQDTGDAQQARQRSESDRISAELGAKLLAGWTMLDAYCPRCTTVLMKSRDGRRLCVACDMFVMTEAEAVALGNTVAGPQPTAGPTAAAAPTAHVPATGISRGSAPVTGSPTIAGRVPAERGGAFAENQLPAAPSRPAPNADDRSARLVTAEHGRGTAAAGSSDSEEAGACADRFATGLPIELRSGPMGDFVSRYRTGFSQRLAPIGAHRIAERSPAASPKRHAGERSQTAADMAEKGDEKHARVNASTDATAVLIAARTTLLDKMLETQQALARTPGAEVEACARLSDAILALGHQVLKLAEIQHALR
eukprot:CAMPEP_0206135772 /NCGR_PEP_ID=MMETSP1473-20131121/1039_1 /ASSEMBLY_ACC=CAM_ASM_001109 /TAXON_ID=1461547 /ORGANISM="Stichococcus sp, Strain RCC1054" /LENGTH=435 /DNA_ID=CAMNT_0053527855 /DNA_START=204 /DNA_END=1511 /DNA_ORIENTATION=+